jgi:hypothetical protein
MLWNGIGRFLQQAEPDDRLHDRKSRRHFRLESLPFDGIERLSASKMLLFLDPKLVTLVSRKMAKQRSPESTVALRSRSLNWVRDFRLDGSHRSPSKIFSRTGLTEHSSALSINAQSSRHPTKPSHKRPRVGCIKPRVIC